MMNADQHRVWVSILVNSKNDKEKRHAAEAIYKEFSGRLKFFFTRRSGNGSDAHSQDLMIQTLEKVFDKIRLYNEKNAFSTWVYTIALNCLRDMKRQHNIEVISVDAINDRSNHVGNTHFNKMDDGGEIFELPSFGSSPCDDAERDERHKEVREAIRTIKRDDERRIVHMRFFQELTYEEITEITELPMGTVKAVLHRAKRKLEKRLEHLAVA